MEYEEITAAMDSRPRRSKKFNFTTSNSSADDLNRHIVKHNYHDHSRDSTALLDDVDETPKRKGPRGGVTVPFPTKLHLMLKSVADEGLDHIVSWQPHGRCFVVHKPKDFVEQIIPTYFRQSKLTSFQRQLNLYGFSRITAGRDRGGYYHELFLRNKLFLSQNMNRIRIKGTGIKGKASPSTEPDFYSMPALLPGDSSDVEYLHLEEELVAAMEEENSRAKTTKATKSKSSKRRKSLSSQSNDAVKAFSMPTPIVSPDTPEKLPLKYNISDRVYINRRRLSQNQTYDDLNPPFMEPPLQARDDVITFEGQQFHYMDSFVTAPAEAQPFSLKPRSSSIVSLPFELALKDPILTPSSSSSSLSEFFRQQESPGSPACEFNPATIFEEKDEEIVGGRYLSLL